MARHRGRTRGQKRRGEYPPPKPGKGPVFRFVTNNQAYQSDFGDVFASVRVYMASAAAPCSTGAARPYTEAELNARRDRRIKAMKLVVIESPYRGDTSDEEWEHIEYMRECLADSISRGEAPFASHGLYTQPGVLNDTDMFDRETGMAAGWAWMLKADLVAVYQDFGISPGMARGIDFAKHHKKQVVYRRLRAPQS